MEVAGKMDHKCLKEDKFKEIDKNFNRLETDLKHEARKHENLRKTINGKLDKIWSAMNKKDGQIITYLIPLFCAFVGTLGAVFIAFMMFFRPL